VDDGGRLLRRDVDVDGQVALVGVLLGDVPALDLAARPAGQHGDGPPAVEHDDAERGPLLRLLDRLGLLDALAHVEVQPQAGPDRGGGRVLQHLDVPAPPAGRVDGHPPADPERAERLGGERDLVGRLVERDLLLRVERLAADHELGGPVVQVVAAVADRPVLLDVPGDAEVVRHDVRQPDRLPGRGGAGRCGRDGAGLKNTPSTGVPAAVASTNDAVVAATGRSDRRTAWRITGAFLMH
jgi:hypothetical protein